MRIESALWVGMGCLCALFVVAAGCEDEVTSRFCEPGEVRACTGPSGCRGVAECNAEGSGFNPCACDATGGTGGSAGTGGGGAVGGSGAQGGSGGQGGSAGGEPDVCRLNNCTTDGHCSRCPDGRTRCLVAEGRCVACDPNVPQDCPAGSECTEWGLCVTEGLTCPTDAGGNPTVLCSANADCAACSPRHQVCDLASNHCTECIVTNTQHCNGSEICSDGACTPKCPASCSGNNDCMYCGGPGSEAHACFPSWCAECGSTWPCPAGQFCENGVCIPPCGQPGLLGVCEGPEDCHYCGASDGWGTWRCNLHGGTGPTGVCGPTIASCGDIAPSADLLPEPYNAHVVGCTTEAQCLGLTGEYDVGALIRTMVGGNELDIGYDSVHICDASEDDGVAVAFGMQQCGSVFLSDTATCGLCAPCREDADCGAFSIEPLIGDLFCNDPLAWSAGAVLTDMLWGDAPSPMLHFFCQPLADEYGICTPCADPTHPCGV